MEVGDLGKEIEAMEDDGFELLFRSDFLNVGGGEEEGLRLQVNGSDIKKYKSNKISHWTSDSRSVCAVNGGSGSQGVKSDVNLNLGSAGEPSSSTSSMGRENFDHETQNKRPKVQSFSPDWGTNLENRTSNLVDDEDVPDSNFDGEHARSSDDTSTVDDSQVRMDLIDDLLHMVFSSLDLVDLCRAARVCRQWRYTSSHEDLWRYLNFKNRRISLQQFEVMCQRYPNATAVNIYGASVVHPCQRYPNSIYSTSVINPRVVKVVSSLRNLEVLTLGKCQLGDDFFEAITGCRTLKSLTVIDATTLTTGQEISIRHDRLRDLKIVKCRLTGVSIWCPELVTLSLNCGIMKHAILNCPVLRELDTASCQNLTDASIRSAATSCRLLESLDISNCSCVRDETLREIAIACQSLHFLDASYCLKISLESLRLPALTVLKLHRCGGINSASMIAINFSHLLEVLELDNCSLLTSAFLDLPRLKNIRLVHCQTLFDLNLRSDLLSSVTISNCPSLQMISITSNALKKLVLKKQESLTSLELQCPCLIKVDLTGCGSLKNSISEAFSDGRGCPVLRSLVLDNCQSLTAVNLISTSLVSLSLGDCRAITSLELNCPNLEHVSLDGCDHLERASFSPVGLKSCDMGICPKMNVLHVEAPLMVSLDLKGCGVLSEAFIYCPLLTSLDASFCSQLKDNRFSATTLLCPLIESLVLTSCSLIELHGLLSLHCLPKLTYLDLSYTVLVNLQPVFDSCLNLKVLKLQACKYLSDTSLEPLYNGGALPALLELDLSYGTLPQSTIEELLARCVHLTHVSLNGCVNMHDLDWGYYRTRLAASRESSEPSNDNLVLSTTGRQRNCLLQNLNCVGCPNIKKVVIPPTASCVRLSSLNISLSSNLKEVEISCCNLLFLNLSNCRSLDTLKLDCPRLTSLFLQWCNIDEEVVETAVIGCSMLETLDVRFCPKITPSSMVTLRAACPSLRRIFSSLIPSLIRTQTYCT